MFESICIFNRASAQATLCVYQGCVERSVRIAANADESLSIMDDDLDALDALTYDGFLQVRAIRAFFEDVSGRFVE